MDVMVCCPKSMAFKTGRRVLMQDKNSNATIQRPPAEIAYRDELEALRRSDKGPRPPGWSLSLKSIKSFILGGNGASAKLVASPSLVERAMVTLATSRALLLIGEPGTAKSFLSELLAAAISGDSKLTIQGGASLTEDQIKYGWNYALLVSEGPTPRALVPAPLHHGVNRTSGRPLIKNHHISRLFQTMDRLSRIRGKQLPDKYKR